MKEKKARNLLSHGGENGEDLGHILQVSQQQVPVNFTISQTGQSSLQPTHIHTHIPRVRNVIPRASQITDKAYCKSYCAN